MLLTKFFDDKDCVEIGVDECARGPLFGRLYVGACVWPSDIESPLIKDSKKYSRNNNSIEQAYDFIMDNCISWGVSYAEPKEIDDDGISYCLIKCMHRAILKTYIHPEHILVDGNYFKILPIDRRDSYTYSTIIGGDNLYYSIACASIIAKVNHDRYINELCATYPILKEYDIHNNMGYGSKKHLDAINNLNGITSMHRLSFGTNKTKKVIFEL